MAHWSSCSLHNAPALPAGPCDCGDDAPTTPNLVTLIPKYNALLSSHDYELNARLRLVEHLHDSGMKYKDIYAIIEKEPSGMTS